MEEQKIFEEIEQYLNGQLDAASSARFEEKLRSDQRLAARVKLFIALDQTLADKKALEVQQQIESTGQQYFPRNITEARVRRLSFRKKVLAMAAVLLVLLAAGLFWWQSSAGSLSDEVLYAQYFTTYSMSDVVRSETPEASAFARATQLYQSGDYQAAQTAFLALLSENPDDMPAAFGLAHAYLNSQPPQPDLALPYFHQVIDDGNTAYVPKAQWYAALIYLKKGEREPAKKLLEEIKGIDKKAAGLLSEIR